MPLVERVVTVTGERIRKPGNFIVKIGTPVKELVEYCGGVTTSDVMLKMGGPMMGFELTNLDVPVMKGTNGIIAVEPVCSEPYSCIRCGRCADVLPDGTEAPVFLKIRGDAERSRALKNRTLWTASNAGAANSSAPQSFRSST